MANRYTPGSGRLISRGIASERLASSSRSEASLLRLGLELDALIAYAFFAWNLQQPESDLVPPRDLVLLANNL
jgi:hypothetical protein